jgi:pyruvate/2-oxoglutarate/acetoin dehydrogenase E1 component
VPIGVARVARDGADVTIVSAMNGVHGIQAEVVDLRILRPLDIDSVLTSIAKTNRIVVVEESPLTGGWAAK